MTSLPLHGGAIDLAARHYGIPDDQWLDLSTGINPRPWPVPAISPDVWQKLPLHADLIRLQQAAAGYYRVANPDHIACAPGTQALIQIIPALIRGHKRGRKILIAGPTYGEHGNVWRQAGFDVAEPNIPAATRASHLRAAIKDCDVMVLVNPNNPDGAVISPNDLMEIAQGMAAKGGWLIIDEAFADTDPAASLCPHITTLDRTLVLRSFGKFFGLAGVRLGFAIGQPDIIATLTTRLGPWAVSGPAIEIATRALHDRDWQDNTRHNLADAAKRLDDLIITNGVGELVGGTDLFRLYRGPDMAGWYDRLARHGILVRAFDYAPDWLRFGLPGGEADWQKLQSVLTA
ncbi:threonine-phosphate decarboxylase CobD [Thalassospira sp.]|uniref:threonine-phosphate decarboxylase CobD n=1 Tax=Thalassospira sp. TaxID=1912094 RepID=UPI002733F573|nr:threonine-phosphate decarboxylase CobD [Thalassospira sp.]MDP2697484.1 threonine-phosphate decarboxylase CobD [Thalassospira sp.]